MLKLILAVSADGRLARGPRDDMSWTGKADKQAFRLLTSVKGVCGAGRLTWELMPRLPGRLVVPLSRKPGMVMHPQDRTGASQTLSMGLGRFAYLYPNAWLLGGPRVAMEALDVGLVDQVYLCRSRAVIGEHGEAFHGIYDSVTPWLENAGSSWAVSQRIPFGDVQVDVWSRHDASRPQP